MNRPLLVIPVVVVVLQACAPTADCAVNTDCLADEECRDGACVAASHGDCTAGTTRVCGNAAVGVCKQGTQTCVNGAWAQACAGEVKPGVEVCNQLDDDCDGQVDEGAAPTRWYPDLDGDGHGDAANAGELACSRAGFVASHDDCNDNNSTISPAAGELCGNAVDDDCDGTVDEGCGCSSVGSTVSCCGGRGTQTCGSDGTLGACSASVSIESCNGVDDDCDGQTDEGTTLCGGGQACVGGGCACSGGQSLCNGVCVTLTAETCDGVDNDCDGQIDEGVTITCVPDADGDLYAESAVGSSQCAGPSGCPAGFIEPPASQGLDCNGADVTRYRLVSSLTDGDGDGACTGTASDDCVGAGPLPGRRFVVSCESMTDCADDNAQAWSLEQVRADADGDGYCVTTVSSVCASPTWLPAGVKRPAQCGFVGDCNDANAGATEFVAVRTDVDGDGYCVGGTSFDCVDPAALPSGKRLAGACQATDDCNDGNAAAYLSITWAADADGDGYCTSTPPPPGGWCSGPTPPVGYRAPSSCLTFTDCAPSDASKWRTASVRADADNDSWCSGAAASACIGTNPPSGQRVADTCAGEDCSDTNGYANSTCVINGGYYTSSHGQTCPSASTPTLYNVTVLNTCPPGFNTVNYRAVRSSGTGSCTYGSPSQVYQQCNFLDGSTCGVVADCVAY